MPRKFRKYRLLLDEGLAPRERFKVLNSRHNLVHVKHNLRKAGISDSEVWKIATREKRVVITYNIRDFERFPTLNKNAGVIGISNYLSVEQIDKKITSLLSKSKLQDLYGKVVRISRESKK